VGGLALLFAAMIACAHAEYLFARHFWIDEIFTFTLVADPDPVHALDALAGGVDMNAPMLYVLLRGFTLLTGGPGEVAFRVFAALSMLLALTGVYLLLRRVYPPFVSFTAVLVLACYPLILTHTFEARFYGPWLAAIVWFAYALVLFRTSPRRMFPGVLLAVCALVVCTIHYFGIITIGLVTAFDQIAHRTLPPRRWALVLVALGPLALFACLPLYLRQRGALSVATWVGAANPQAAGEFAVSVFRPLYLGLIMLAWLLSVAGSVAFGTGGRRYPVANATGLAGLTSLLLLPVVLVVFSYTMLPVLVDRYALPALAGIAPVAAFFLARTNRFLLTALCAVLIVLGTRDLSGRAERAREADGRVDALIATLRQQTPDTNVLFESSHDLAVVCRYAPDQAGRCYFLDFEPGDLHGVSTLQIVLRDVARRYAAYYGRPGVMPWAEARELRQVFLVPGDPRYFRTRERYPGYGLRPVRGRLHELVKLP
jgi:hypothetical protein